MIEKQMREFAEKNFVPIVREKTSKLLIEKVKDVQPLKILEVGTAIGYSGILMLKNSNAKLVTLEINEEMKNIALKNFEKENLLDRVNLVFGDCKEYIEQTKEKFDFIFLDGPKSQYKKYYPFLINELNDNGMIFVDNVLFQGYVLSEKEPPKKFRTIVKNLREFISVIQNDNNVEAEIIDLEDGVAIIKKRLI